MAKLLPLFSTTKHRTGNVLNVRWSKWTLCKTTTHIFTTLNTVVVAAFIALYCLSVFPFYRWAMYPVLFLIRINLWIILLIASSLLICLVRHSLNSFIISQLCVCVCVWQFSIFFAVWEEKTDHNTGDDEGKKGELASNRENGGNWERSTVVTTHRSHKSHNILLSQPKLCHSTLMLITIIAFPWKFTANFTISCCELIVQPIHLFASK